MERRKALITGISGQDGSYLAELLLAKGYEVHGIVRDAALKDDKSRLHRIQAIRQRAYLHAGALDSLQSLQEIVRRVQPDECYHLAAQSFVGRSFENEFATLNSNINGTHFMLAAVKETAPSCRFFFAGSSEMFGKAAEIPQSESTGFHPRSAYGISKAAAFNLTRNYREVHNLFACSGILFNHESPRRGHEFVTRKISAGVAAIAAGKATQLTLGNLEARRDWGYAPEYVEAMWRMLQQAEPDDYVIASGEAHSVLEFCQAAFACVGLDYSKYVVTDPGNFRPAEIDILLGDPSKAAGQLGWVAQTKFEALVRLMVEADCKQLGVQSVR